MALEKEATIIPTLTISDLLVRYGGQYDLPEWALKKMEEVHDIHIENIRRAYKAGVRLATGTDLFVGIKDLPLYGMNAMEIRLLNELIGMKPLEAIEAATGNAAYATGRESFIGTIEKNKSADLIVVKGDPLDDPTLLIDSNNIKIVMKEGMIMKNTLLM